MDFLASFNFDADNAANPRSTACASIEEVQLRLADSLGGKATDTRAEHVATIFDIGAAARFSLSLSSSEHNAIEGLSNLDPSLGVGATSADAEGSEEPVLRDFSAADALTNQPQDDPMLQRALARHIISAVSGVDGCAWIMREMSRGSQGWSFFYLCKDSAQQWNRQNKAKSKPIIGEYTQKDMDPTLASRPAFDCRGKIGISFDRGTRSISITYDHTPLHKTVAEVAEFFKPPPRPTALPRPDKADKQKSPKKVPSARKKRDSTKALDEHGNPRKRRKKNASEAHVPDGPVQDQQQSFGQGGTQNGQGTLQLADGAAGDGAAGDGPAMDAAQQEHGSLPPSGAANFPFNLSPEEEERRRDAATKLLSEAGVDPNTLSKEQFNIFANQSPDLQRESLNMLAKYGAERLRIVHPSNRDSSVSVPPSAATTSAQTSHTASSGHMTMTELVPRGAASEDETQTASKRQKRSKVGKSRNACFQCKGRKVKCLRERPSCAECQIAGLSCEYAPPRSRKKQSKSDAVVPANFDTEGDSQLESGTAQPQAELQDSDLLEHPLAVQQSGGHEIDQDESDLEELRESVSAQEVQGEQMGEGEGEASEADEPDYSYYPQMPVSDMLTPNVDSHDQATRQTAQSQLPYFRSASGLALPQPEEPPVSQQIHTSAPGLVLPQGTVHFPAMVTPTTAETVPLHQRADEALHLLGSPQQAAQVAKRPRRHLPPGPQRQGPDEASIAPAEVAGWQSAAQSGAHLTGAVMNSSRPRTSQSQQHTGAEPASVASNPQIPAPSSQMHDIVALSQAAVDVQRHAQGLPMTMQASTQSQPFHAADDLHTKSRQAQRAQSKTPRAGQSSGSPFQAPSSVKPAAVSTSQGSSQYRAATHDVDSSSSFTGHYGNYRGALPNPSTSDRIGYEPYSYQRSYQSTSSFPAYDYNRSTPSTMPIESPSMTSAHAASNPNQSDSLSASGGHRGPSRTNSPYNNHGNSAPGPGRRIDQGFASSADFNLRTASQQVRAGQGHESGSVNRHHHPQQQQQHQQQQQQQQQQQHQQRQQQQPQPQPQQLSQQQQPQQQRRQQPAQGPQVQKWPDFNDPNHPSYPFGSQRSSYNWNLQEEPWGGVS